MPNRLCLGKELIPRQIGWRSLNSFGDSKRKRVDDSTRFLLLSLNEFKLFHPICRGISSLPRPSLFGIPSLLSEPSYTFSSQS